MTLRFRTRFNVSVLVLSSIGLAQLIVQWVTVNAPSLIAQVLILILCVFSHEWNFVHGEALTRHRRTHFNVANVLETYQPRARTEGHLFQPEPPTPGDVAVLHSNDEDDSKKSEFINQRDASVTACSSLDAAQLENVVLKPADPEKDKKEHEEKKKKEAEEYHKQFEKPFSC
uniref:Protein Y37E11AL.2 n=1 Tax=Haemonchus contortus TaxID=6289 RepID=W6NEM2_HAECO